jgi:hypothetical protein
MSTPEPGLYHHADEEVVLGVDTHKDVHVAAVTSPLGKLLATAASPRAGRVRSGGPVRR